MEANKPQTDISLPIKVRRELAEMYAKKLRELAPTHDLLCYDIMGEEDKEEERRKFFALLPHKERLGKDSESKLALAYFYGLRASALLEACRENGAII